MRGLPMHSATCLAGVAWSAYRWETPPLVERGLDGPFEFVLVDSPELANTPNADVDAFAEARIQQLGFGFLSRKEESLSIF